MTTNILVYKGRKPDWVIWMEKTKSELRAHHQHMSSEKLEAAFCKACYELSLEEMEAFEKDNAQLKHSYFEMLHQQSLKFESAKTKFLEELVKSGYAGSSKEVKYIKNVTMGKSCFHYNFDVIMKARKRHEDFLVTQTVVTKQEAKLMRAVQYLQDDGLTLGVDFNLKNAIAKANERARVSAIQEASEQDDVEHSSCDYCDSWDPSESRCSCGNRRMDWGHYGDFENMQVFPVAY